MDAVSYSLAAKQAQRIKKFVAEPDVSSGLVTVPSVVASGETVSIPAGRTLVHPNLQVDGTLQVNGTMFIPSGGTYTAAQVDVTVVKQNGNVVANDTAVVHNTGNETVAGVKTFSSLPIINGKNAISQNTTAYNVDTTSFIANTLESGAIIERGSNANGEYVKFADGTLIHIGRYIGQTTQNAGGTAASASFSHAFINTNIKIAFSEETVGLDCKLTFGSQTTTYIFPNMRLSTGAGVGIGTALPTYNLIAIGRWK